MVEILDHKMEPISFGQCGICGQGDLIAMKVADSGRLLLMCDDCESQWNTPRDSRFYDKALTKEISGLVVANSQDVIGARWKKPT